MNHSRIRQDLERLANALPHRAANTDNERAAAEYIAQRFREYTSDVEIDDFYSPENPTYLFASYYGEFLIVTLLNYWYPWLALVYGMGVMLAYIAEFNGFALLARLLPQYETQNVVARFLGAKPSKLIVVSANYDTGVSSLLSEPRVLKWLRSAHILLLCAMAVILVTCGLKAVGAEDAPLYSAVCVARNVALAALLLGGGFLVYADFNGEHVRGAVNNAGGAAALLALCEELRANPVENADIWFVATGAKESWMDGMRHLVGSHNFDRRDTYFINIASAGSGGLRYTVGEGMLHLYRSSDELLAIAKTRAPEFAAGPLRYRSFPTDAAIPLARGYKTLGLMTSDGDGVPPYFRSLDDNITRVSEENVAAMAEYAGAIVRGLGGSDGDPEH